jgi:uncharacterized membrane protein YsdA (DUF1294 family)
MNRGIFIALLVVAFGIYGWDIQLAIREYFGTKVSLSTTEKTLKTTTVLSGDFTGVFTASVQFKEKGKSPFLSYMKKPEPVAPKEVKRVAAPPKQDVAQPQIKINGIMWNLSNPVAMIALPGGSSAVVKKGQLLQGEIEIVSIEKDKIQIKYKGCLFWIKK